MSEAWVEIEQLILDARRGCSKAIGILIRSYQPLLLQIANRDIEPALKVKAGASDIVQVTCMDVARSIEQFRGNSPQQLSKWLIEILRNNISTTRRFHSTSKRDFRRESPQDRKSWPTRTRLNADYHSTRVMSPLSEILHKEATTKLESALASLSELDRQVIVLRNRDRMSFVEIGRHIGRSSDAARKIWSRAIETLQRRVRQSDEHPV